MTDDNNRPSFGHVLRELLLERDITTGMGNPNWSAFAEELDGVHYETLRKAVTGDRAPSPLLMEAVSDALGVDPADTFWQYRLWAWRRQFDPDEVGEEEALANFERWAKQQRKR